MCSYCTGKQADLKGKKSNAAACSGVRSRQHARKNRVHLCTILQRHAARVHACRESMSVLNKFPRSEILRFARIGSQTI